MRLLIIDDDDSLTTVLKCALEHEGHDVNSCEPSEGLRMVTQCEYDLLLLDLPSVPEWAVFMRRAVESQPEARILVFCGSNRISDRVRALNDGADDIVMKPFSMVELNARVRAIARRSRVSERTVVRVGDLCINRLQGSVQRAGREIELTPKEFSLLELLAANAGKPVTRTRILGEVWRTSVSKPSNIVDVYINYLRKKVDGLDERKLVHTIRGVGYCLGEPVLASASQLLQNQRGHYSAV